MQVVRVVRKEVNARGSDEVNFVSSNLPPPSLVFVKKNGSDIRRQNVAVRRLQVFTTDSSRFASYVTNGLSGVGGGKRDLLLLNERGGKKKKESSTAFEFTWQFTFRLGHPQTPH